MNLVIVESPAKCKKIQSYLGPGWVVVASVGHIRDLPKKDLGVDLEAFKPTYEITKPDVVKKLKSKAREATEIWLATDPDREGEAIAWHLQRVLGLKEAKRITFNEITQKAVRAAVAQPRTVDINRVASQESRRVADRLVGYLVSPKLSDLANDRLSAGRVQSVVVKLVAERDDAIASFVVTDHFTVELTFNDSQTWTAKLETKPFITDENPYITDRNLIDQVAAVKAVKVMGNETISVFKKAPGPFMTDTLQQAASVQLKMSTDKTMKAAQKLYEQGFITYHRTDFPNLSEEGRELVYTELRVRNLGDCIPDEPNLEKVAAGSQEAHEAIRPADFSRDAGELDADCRKLYHLIVERTLASQLKPAEYQKQTITLESFDVSVGEIRPTFTSVASTLVNPGWKSLTPSDQAGEGDDAEDDSSGTLPDINYGAMLINFTANVKDKKTKPPAKYTEASIIKYLKKMDIGRPSTYASIMKNITERGYIVFSKQKISATDKGRLVVDLLKEFTFMDYTFTKELEGDLDKVAKGQLKYRDVVSKLFATLNTDMDSLKGVEVKVTNPCPKCGKQVNRVPGKHGFFWSCTGFKDNSCDFTAEDSRGKMLSPEEAQARREKKKKQQEQTDIACTCGAGQLVRRQAKKKGPNGEKQYWYGCNQFPKCDKTFFEVDGKPKMDKVAKAI